MNIRLSFLSKGRVNNLNLIRMLAAIGVLISHSFPLTLGRGAGDLISNSFGVPIGNGLDINLSTASYVRYHTLST